MTTTGCSFNPLNDLATLAGLLIKFGGDPSLVGKKGAVWFVAKVGDKPANVTGDRGDTVEVTEDSLRDSAAVAAELEKR
jgi:hypothetical protein